MVFAFTTALVMKKITVLPDFDKALIAPGLMIVFMGCIVVMLFMGGTTVHIGNVPQGHYVWLAFYALAYALLQYFFWHAVSTAPNPGFVLSFLSASSVFVLFASYFLFGSELGLQKVIGVVIVFSGLVLISLPS